MKHTKRLSVLGAGLLGLLLLTGCAVPGGPGTASTGKVILHTPYGSQSRVIEGGYFQSTVVPQNLEAAISTFAVTLSGPGGTFTQTVTFDQASQFVFDNVPAGAWNLKVEGLNGGSQVVARGVYNGFFVTNGQLTDVPDLITVSPTRPAVPGPESGDFNLTLRNVPSEVKSVSLDYRVVFISPADGSFDIQNRLADTPDILVHSLSLPVSGYRTLNIHTNSVKYGGVYGGEQTGTMLLTVKFQNEDGTLVHTFQPVFTVDVYQNLESTLDLTLPADLSNVSTVAPPSLSVTTDVNGNAVVHWSRPLARNFVTAFQIGQNAVGSSTPPTAGEILATVPNIGYLTSYATGVNLAQQPGATAQFWVRTISAGLYLSSWVSVTAVSNLTPGDPFDLFVSPTGSDTADGSRNTPFATIQKAIDTAQLRGNFGQETRIFVAEGTYNLSAGLVNAPRNVDGLGGNEPAVPISLLGGYYSNFSLHGDPVNHPTVLHDTGTTGSPASNGAEIYFGQTGLPSLPTPQTLDGFTIEQTMGPLGSDSFVGVWVEGAINLTVSHLTLVQNAPANASGLVNGLQIEINRTATDPARTIVLQANQIFQRASGATHGSPSGVFRQGIWVALAVGGVTPNPVIRVENNLVVHEATTGENYPISIQPNLASARIRNNTVVTDLVAGQVALQVYPVDSLVENNLLVNLNPTVGNALEGNTLASSPGLVFHNNIISGYLNPYWDGSSGTSMAGLNNHGTSSANGDVAGALVHFANPSLNNYRLTTDSDMDILWGGLNGGNQAPPWPFGTDLDGTERTSAWTPGAYETDIPPLVSLGATFGSPRSPDYTIPAVADRAAYDFADFNNDGTKDIVVTTGPSATGIQIYTQSPPGTFTLTQQLSNLTGGNNFGSYALTVGDLRNNGYPAVITGGPNGDNYSPNAVFGNTAGTLAVNGTTTYTSNGVAFYGFRVATGRLNGDLYDDVVWSDPSNLWVGLSNGSGGFSSIISYPKSGLGSEVNSLVLADLDGDGDLDAATPRTYNGAGQGSLLFFLNNGSGGFGTCQVEPSSAATYYNPWAVAVADVTGDGKKDLLVVNQPSFDSVDLGRDLWIGKRTSADGAVPTYTFERLDDPFYRLSGGGGYDVQSGDYNQDGTPDFVVATNNGVKLYVSDTVGTWKPTMLTNSSVSAARFVDMNGDGKLDIVTAESYIGVYYQ